MVVWHFLLSWWAVSRAEGKIASARGILNGGACSYGAGSACCFGLNSSIRTPSMIARGLHLDDAGASRDGFDKLLFKLKSAGGDVSRLFVGGGSFQCQNQN